MGPLGRSIGHAHARAYDTVGNFGITFLMFGLWVSRAYHKLAILSERGQQKQALGFRACRKPTILSERVQQK